MIEHRNPYEGDPSDETTEDLLRSMLQAADEVVERLTADEINDHLKRLMEQAEGAARGTAASVDTALPVHAASRGVADARVEFDPVASIITRAEDLVQRERIIPFPTSSAGGAVASKHSEPCFDPSTDLINVAGGLAYQQAVSSLEVGGGADADVLSCQDGAGPSVPECDSTVQNLQETRKEWAQLRAEVAQLRSQAEDLQVFIGSLYDDVFARTDSIYRGALARADTIEEMARQKADRCHNDALDVLDAALRIKAEAVRCRAEAPLGVEVVHASRHRRGVTAPYAQRGPATESAVLLIAINGADASCDARFRSWIEGIAASSRTPLSVATCGAEDRVSRVEVGVAVQAKSTSTPRFVRWLAPRWHALRREVTECAEVSDFAEQRHDEHMLRAVSACGVAAIDTRLGADECALLLYAADQEPNDLWVDGHGSTLYRLQSEAQRRGDQGADAILGQDDHPHHVMRSPLW